MEILRHFKAFNFFICVLSSKVVTVILVPYVVAIAFCSMTFYRSFLLCFLFSFRFLQELRTRAALCQRNPAAFGPQLYLSLWQFQC